MRVGTKYEISGLSMTRVISLHQRRLHCTAPKAMQQAASTTKYNLPRSTGDHEVRVTRKYERPRSPRYQKAREITKCELRGSMRYYEVRDTRKHEMPQSTNDQEVRDTTKCNLTGSMRCHEVGNTGKYEIPRSTRYHDVRDTRKYEIPRSTRYQLAKYYRVLSSIVPTLPFALPPSGFEVVIEVVIELAT